jgi:hypothetical protein
VRARLSEVISALRDRKIEVLVIGFKNLNLGDVARAENVGYAEWNLAPGQYNAQGYAIVVERMLPQIEALIARLKAR